MLDAFFSTILFSDTIDDARANELLDLGRLNNFVFDYEDEIENLGSNTALSDALNNTPTSITDTAVVWGNTTDGITVNGLGLSGIGSLEALQTSLENGLATGSYLSIDVYSYGTNVLQIQGTGSAFSIISGNQTLSFTGQIPTNFQDIFDLLEGLTSLANGPLADLSDVDFNSYISALDDFNLTGVSISDSGDEIASLSRSTNQISANLAGLQLTVNGTFDFDNMADFVEVLRDFELNSGGAVDLSTIPELGFDSLSLVGADGTILGNINGPAETDEEFEIGVLTVEGTDEDDRDIFFEEIADFGAAETNVDLGAGNDEINIEFGYTFVGDLYDGIVRDIFIDGGTPLAGETDYDELDLTSDVFGIYTIDLEAGVVQAVGDPFALYTSYYNYYDYDLGNYVYDQDRAADRFDPERASLFVDIDIANFTDVDLDFWNGGDVYVTGNDSDNLIDLKSIPDYFEIDGGGSTDRLKLDNMSGFLEFYNDSAPFGYYDYVDLSELSRQEFGELFYVVATSDGWYDVTFDLTGEMVGRFRNIEEITFFDEIDGEVTFNAADILDNDVIRGDGRDEFLLGDDGYNVILGEGGNDVLRGFGGADIVEGGAGDDFVFGDDLPVFYFLDTAASVYRLYQATLDREPDSNGHQNWTTRVATDELTLLQAANGFVNSTEFKNTYGDDLSNGAFVELLYQNILNRAADDAGLARWTGDLENGVSKAQVVLGLSNSTEFKNNTNADANQFAQANTQQIWVDDVYRLYQATLNREPDVAGMFNRSERLGSGTDYLDEAAGFVNSTEFKNNYGDDLTNTQFVELMYDNVLGRAADAGGLARWVGDLEGGASRTEVVRGLAQSGEFRNNTADGLETWMRENAEGDVLVGGPGDDVMAGGYGADVFRFKKQDIGKDTVLDFEAWDFVDLTDFGYSDYIEAQAAFTQVGGDVVFSQDGVEAVFKNASEADFGEDALFL